MTKAKTAKTVAVKPSERLYNVIRKPVVTEKSTMGSQYGQLTFRVPLDATKEEIRTAVETLFKVKVTKVNTLIQKGKLKVFKGRQALRSDSKKAIVTLAEGQTVDVTTGL
jgi:large subunit ribosomal protein L23